MNVTERKRMSATVEKLIYRQSIVQIGKLG